MSQLTTFRSEDGLWHATEPGAHVSLCGLVVPPSKPGRKRVPSCGPCIAAARELDVARTPVFWGWHDAPAPKPAAPTGSAVPPDPPAAPDRRCAYEPCGKKIVVTKQARKYAGYLLDADPFCSSKCCKAFHGIVFNRALDGEPDDSDFEAAA